MGKKGTRKKAVGTTPGSVTLREESSGKKTQSHVNAKSMLKLDHLKNLAIWASGESTIPSLGAFFGQRLAASAESLSVPPDPSLFTCQRCESILQTGYNCTVRIEKNKKKARNRRKKPGVPPKNFVVYECRFCSHRNLKRGTPKNYMKDLYPAKTTLSRVDSAKSALREPEQLDTSVANFNKARVDPTESAVRKFEQLDTVVASISKANIDPTEPATGKSELFDTSVASTDRVTNTDVTISSEIVEDEPTATPATPSSTVTVTSLLDSKRKKRNRTGSKKKTEPQDGSSMTDADKNIPTSSRKGKRKSWTSLKEIAESEGSNSKKFSNLSIPFIL